MSIWNCVPGALNLVGTQPSPMPFCRNGERLPLVTMPISCPSATIFIPWRGTPFWSSSNATRCFAGPFSFCSSRGARPMNSPFVKSTQEIARAQPAGFDAGLLPSLQERFPDCRRLAGWDVELIADLAGIAGPRHDGQHVTHVCLHA